LLHLVGFISLLTYAVATVITEEINENDNTNKKFRVQKYPVGLDAKRRV